MAYIKFKKRFKLPGFFLIINTQTVYFYSILIGFAGGLAAIGFNELLAYVSHLFLGGFGNMTIPSPAGEPNHYLQPVGEANRWVLLILPVIGGLISGLLIKLFAPEAEGTGTDSYIKAFHKKGGVMRGRTPFIKSLATIATLATGGSAGKEGPIAQIGAGIGSFLGNIVKMGARARRTMLVAGAAAGLGAIFKAPLGGALTAAEVLYKEDIETDVLTPCILSSVTAYTVFCSYAGFNHVFSFQTKLFHSPTELIFYALLGILCSGFGFLYVRFFHGAKKYFFDKLPINKFLVPAFGGLLVGLVGFFFPQVMGQGFGYLQQAIDGKLGNPGWETIRLFLMLAILKIMTTSFTISSGGSGGVFAPSLFIGGMLGAFVGTISHQFYPEIVMTPESYIVVGMGAFFAGVANAPIASLLMVCELTGAYELLLPLMLVATISIITSRKWSIYTNQVTTKFYSEAHIVEMNPYVLKEFTVDSVFKGKYKKKAIIPNSLLLSDIKKRVKKNHEMDLILENSDHELVGIICFKELVYDSMMQDIADLALAQDLVNRSLFYVKPGDNLISALELILSSEFDKVPVAENRDDKLILLGYIQYRDILNFYRNARTDFNYYSDLTPNK